MNIYNNIALRSLNQVKTLNPIMYISIRCFFEDFSNSSAQNGLFNDFIERKLKVRKNWSTKQNKLFKEKEGDSFIYRDTLSLSTFGIISESYLLRLISQQNCINNKEFVYSYSLPQYVNSTRNFKYYFNGFKRRNENVHNILKSDKDLIAVVLDLTKFYPSINKENVKQLFFKEIDNNSEDNILSMVENITNSILEQSINGVPIGLDLSHLMAQVYLSDFDKQLSSKYPKKYFRYVDDIIIVCDKSDKDKVVEYVNSQLPHELTINETKTDELTLEDWSLLNSSNDAKEGNLYEVLNYITAYISMHPSRIESLESAIKSLGYNIPLSRIKKQAKSKGFMFYIKSLMKNDKRYGTFEIYFTKNDFIVQQLINLQKFYRIKLKKLLELNYDDTNSAENRSNTQQLKYIVNQLLYLSSTEELERIKNALPNTTKFEDTKEVINALSSKNLTHAIQYGGKVVQTISELWNENNFDTIIIEKSDLDTIQNIDNIIDSIIIFYLYKVIEFPIHDVLDLLNDYNKEYIQVVLCDEYTIQNHEYSFLVELQGMFQGRDLNTKHKLLTTRFDNDESIQLAGLDLGLAYSL
ncbi:RNA-directed DNA polymerase [Sulfurimonas sp. NW7]|uniref:RNA-directed DNA polymerase n=1 Tax=Sulfurimonas sp. NW7 TaxID=2922727 RepID=UPI003DA7B8FC